MDPLILRRTADVVSKEARRLKHCGDSQSKTKPRRCAEYYLHSSLKFLEYALLYEDLKHIYKAQGDSTRSKAFGDQGLVLLAQTGSLIEVTAQAFSSAQLPAYVAISYKFAAIVYMYIFRSKRVRIQAVHTGLLQEAAGSKRRCSPGESPKEDSNLSSPASSIAPSPPLSTSTSVKTVGPLGGSSLGAGDTSGVLISALKLEYYLKESTHVLKAFELWHQVAHYDPTLLALPEVTDFATADVRQTLRCVADVVATFDAMTV